MRQYSITLKSHIPVYLFSIFQMNKLLYGFFQKILGGKIMKVTKRITRYKIITDVSKRIITEKEKLGLITYNGYNHKKQERKDNKDKYKENKAKERFNKSLKFLHMTYQKTYTPIFTDITYIIALYYDIGNNSDWKCTLNRIINENYINLDANELASFFMPFYEMENWNILKNTNETETQNLKEFLHRHEKTFKLFIELWKLDIKCYKRDLGLLCSSFYNHNDLPSKEKYQKILDAYEK